MPVCGETMLGGVLALECVVDESCACPRAVVFECGIRVDDGVRLTRQTHSLHAGFRHPQCWLLLQTQVYFLVCMFVYVYVHVGV